MGIAILTALYLLGAAVTYLLAIDMLNVRLHLRRLVALLIASAWLPILIIAAVFLGVDLIELAWRKHLRWGRR
tara:strand:- start:255874 stop:256092 length:219 start_codon:yes stop_codon:yes gene_type:complete